MKYSGIASAVNFYKAKEARSNRAGQAKYQSMIRITLVNSYGLVRYKVNTIRDLFKAT